MRGQIRLRAKIMSLCRDSKYFGTKVKLEAWLEPHWCLMVQKSEILSNLIDILARSRRNSE